jgi:hypothetical protein
MIEHGRNETESGAINVGGRIESCDPGLPAEARDQVDHLRVGEDARRIRGSHYRNCALDRQTCLGGTFNNTLRIGRTGEPEVRKAFPE